MDVSKLIRNAINRDPLTPRGMELEPQEGMAKAIQDAWDYADKTPLHKPEEWIEKEFGFPGETLATDKRGINLMKTILKLKGFKIFCQRHDFEGLTDVVSAFIVGIRIGGIIERTKEEK